MFRRLIVLVVTALAIAGGAFAQSSAVCSIDSNFAGAFDGQAGNYAMTVSPGASGTLRAHCTPDVDSFNWNPGNLQTAQIAVTAPTATGAFAAYTLTGCNAATTACAPPVTITLQVASPGAPDCTMTASPNPATSAQSVTFNVSCSAALPPPAFIVFRDLSGTFRSASVLSFTDTAPVVTSPTVINVLYQAVGAGSASSAERVLQVTVNPVAVPPAPANCTVSAAPNPVALGLSTVLTAQCAGGGAPATYAFTSPAGAVVSGVASTLAVTPAAIGTQTYTMVASNAGGSAPPATVNVVAQAAVCTISASLPNPVPRNTPVTLTASCNNQPVSYAWSTAAGPVAGANAASLVAGPAATTTYTVTATSGIVSAAPVVATGQYAVVVATASAIVPVAGGPLTGTPGRPLSRPMQVRVTDAAGNPVAQELVSWSVVNPGPSPGSFAANPSPATDAQGLTSNTFTMGNDPGGRTLRACLSVVQTPACTDFQVAAGATGLVAIAGTPLVGAPGRPLSRELQVQATNAQGPVPQEIVNWSVVNPGSSPGSFAGNPSAATDAQGITRNTFTMGNDAGGRTLRACLASLPSACADFQVRSLNAAVERPAAKIMSPMAEVAVATPLAQLSNIRFRLEQLRLRRNPAVLEALRVSVAGQALPSFGAFALAPLDKNGKPAPQKGGGAAADDPFERLGVFVNGDVEIGRQSATGVQNGYDLRTRGLTVGADYRLPGDSVVGLAAGFMNANTDLAEAGGSQGARGYSVSAYGSFVPAPGAYVDVIAHAGSNKYDTRRREVTDAGLAVDYNSNTRGNQYAFAITAGADFNRGGLTMNPYLRLDYVNATINQFSESGDEGAIRVGDLDLKTTVATLGGQLSYAISTSWGVLSPNARLELQRRVQGDGRNVSAQLVADGTVNAQVPLEAVDRNYGNVAIGFSAVLPRGVSGFANYERLFGREGYSNSKYTLGVRFEF